MFEKNLQIGLLLDFYGELLDERTGEMMTEYFENDLSLSEIADTYSMTRQGVHRIIKKGEEMLHELEEKLKLADQFTRLRNSVSRIKEAALPLTEQKDESIAVIGSEICSEADLMLSLL